MHSIYEYDDHRRFLLDAFQEKKRRDSSWSHRKCARAAGIANPGYLNDVVKGRRPLSRVADGKMGKGFVITLVQIVPAFAVVAEGLVLLRMQAPCALLPGAIASATVPGVTGRWCNRFVQKDCLTTVSAVWRHGNRRL